MSPGFPGLRQGSLGAVDSALPRLGFPMHKHFIGPVRVFPPLEGYAGHASVEGVRQCAVLSLAKSLYGSGTRWGVAVKVLCAATWCLKSSLHYSAQPPGPPAQRAQERRGEEAMGHQVVMGGD